MRRSPRDKYKVRKNELVRKVAKNCGYHIYEVEDVFHALLTQIRSEIIDGNSIEFEQLFTIEVSDSKKDWMNRRGEIIAVPQRRALKLRPTRTFLDELRRIAKAQEQAKDSQE